MIMKYAKPFFELIQTEFTFLSDCENCINILSGAELESHSNDSCGSGESSYGRTGTESFQKENLF